jgi:oligopeptide/dipeptide ABC transporter ATP-binding protein
MSERSTIVLDRPDLLQLRSVSKDFVLGSGRLRAARQVVHAVDDVSFSLKAGDTMALVGESGCGKSTTGRLITRLIKPTAGQVVLDGIDLTALSPRDLRPHRRNLSMVFQDPQASLNPRMTVGRIIGEPLRVHSIRGRQASDRVTELLVQVGLGPQHAQRFPHEFSGGQRQRIGIARALALRPKVVVLDEPVSALDVSIQAQILNLLEDLQDSMGLAYVFVSHDLSVVRLVADRIAVMYLGRIMELGTRDAILDQPAHPYSLALLSSVPLTDPSERGRRERIILSGDVPSPTSPPSGCVFRTRCWKATERCAHERPTLRTLPDGRSIACHFPHIRMPNEAQAVSG